MRYAPEVREMPEEDEQSGERPGDDEKLDQSPVPDPTSKDTDAEDDPEAD